MRIKICGITQPDQGLAIASLGATALGFICVEASPRYVSLPQLRSITTALPSTVQRIGVFANASIQTLQATVTQGNLTAVQLHGQESPDFCQQVRQVLPGIELIKALRIKRASDLAQTHCYEPCIDTFLLDAYHPAQLGGTGKTLDWPILKAFQPSLPWFLAGGLNPDNIQTALTQVQPDGIDLSSGVEKAPGDKDLKKVKQLFEALQVLGV
jgi:phosphoribosylanthranilate isomerase